MNRRSRAAGDVSSVEACETCEKLAARCQDGVVTTIRVAHTADLDPGTLPTIRALLDDVFEGDMEDIDLEHATRRPARPGLRRRGRRDARRPRIGHPAPAGARRPRAARGLRGGRRRARRASPPWR